MSSSIKHRVSVERNPQNPIIVPEDIMPSDPALEVACVINPGAFEYDGKIWLLARVAERPIQREGKIATAILDNGSLTRIEFDRDNHHTDLRDPRWIRYQEEFYLSTLSHLRLLCSDDGIHFRPPSSAYREIVSGFGIHETFGVEDCRVSKIEDAYYLTFSQVSQLGVSCGLIRTSDWKTYERLGTIFPPSNKDCAIFDKKINGQYYCFHRPSGNKLGGMNIWLASSTDLVHWGNHLCLLTTRDNMWDEERVGAGAAPIETPDGWLAIYHGADYNLRYCLGAILLDKNDPRIVLARSNDPIMEPAAEYEIEGFFSEVVFTNGHIVRGDEIWMYYGASDESICLAKLSITDLLESLK